jgi:hypothetical protein
VGCGVADDAAFADVLAAGFELGLDEDNGFALPLGFGGSECGEDGGEDEGGGDEADVHREEAYVLRGGREFRTWGAGDLGGVRVELAGGEEASVGAFEEGDAGVGAELVVDLAVAGVDGQYGGGAVLEEAVGEAAGGGADVGAGEGLDGDGPGGEGGFEFEAAAGDVAEVVAEEADDGGVVDRGAGFVDALLVDEDAAGDDEGLGALAGGGEGAVNEDFVEAEFHGCGAVWPSGQDRRESMGWPRGQPVGVMLSGSKTGVQRVVRGREVVVEAGGARGRR